MGKRGKPKKSIRKVVLGWILMIAVLLLIIFAVIVFTSQREVVKDRTMYPTLQEEDVLAVDRIRYRFFNPRRYDVVVFSSRYDAGVTYIRRIIGLPGETVRIVGGKVYINGVVLDSDTYGAEPVMQAGAAYGTITLGADEYFVLGDNRNACTDSREPSVGNIRRDELAGVVLMRIWPLSRISLLR